MQHSKILNISGKQLILHLDLKFGNLQHERLGYWRTTSGTRKSIVFSFSEHGSTERIIDLTFVVKELSAERSEVSWTFKSLNGESEISREAVEATSLLIEEYLSELASGT